MKITCNVIQDLLPSYLDDILSEDSKALVEEHIKSCKNCCKILKTIQESEKQEKKPISDNANVLHQIKKKLLCKRILTAVIAVVFTLCTVEVAYHYWYFHETYLTLEDSGIYVENNKLYSSKNLVSRIRTLYVDDGKTELIYAVDAGYAGKIDLDGKNMLVQDFSDKTNEISPDDESTPKTVEKIYYLSEKAVEEIHTFIELDTEGKKYDAEKMIDEIKRTSELICTIN